MHESSVAARIVETVQEYEGLRAVFVSVGQKSCVHPEMLRDAFDIVKRGTPAGNAELVTLPCPGCDIAVLSVEVEDAKDRDQQKRVQRRPSRGGGKSPNPG